MIRASSWEEVDRYVLHFFWLASKTSDLIQQIKQFAPSAEAKTGAEEWARDAATHRAIWERVLKNREMDEGKMDFSFWRLFKMTDNYVERRDWVGTMIGLGFIAHVLNEGMPYIYRRAANDLRPVLKKLVGDYMGHIDFVSGELAKIHKYEGEDDHVNRTLGAFLKELSDWAFRLETTNSDLDILNSAYHSHRIAMKAQGVSIPKIYFTRDPQTDQIEIIQKLLAR